MYFLLFIVYSITTSKPELNKLLEKTIFSLKPFDYFRWNNEERLTQKYAKLNQLIDKTKDTHHAYMLPSNEEVNSLDKYILPEDAVSKHIDNDKIHMKAGDPVMKQYSHKDGVVVKHGANNEVYILKQNQLYQKKAENTKKFAVKGGEIVDPSSNSVNSKNELKLPELLDLNPGFQVDTTKIKKKFRKYIIANPIDEMKKYKHAKPFNAIYNEKAKTYTVVDNQAETITRYYSNGIIFSYDNKKKTFRIFDKKKHDYVFTDEHTTMYRNGKKDYDLATLAIISISISIPGAIDGCIRLWNSYEDVMQNTTSKTKNIDKLLDDVDINSILLLNTNSSITAIPNKGTLNDLIEIPYNSKGTHNIHSIWILLYAVVLSIILFIGLYMSI